MQTHTKMYLKTTSKYILTFKNSKKDFARFTLEQLQKIMQVPTIMEPTKKVSSNTKMFHRITSLTKIEITFTKDRSTKEMFRKRETGISKMHLRKWSRRRFWSTRMTIIKRTNLIFQISRELMSTLTETKREYKEETIWI
jgi:hypothetical protein